MTLGHHPRMRCHTRWSLWARWQCDIDLRSSIHNRLYNSRRDEPSPSNMRYRSRLRRLRWGIDSNIRVWSIVHFKPSPVKLSVNEQCGGKDDVDRYLCDPSRAIPTHSNSSWMDSFQSSILALSAPWGRGDRDGMGMWIEEDVWVCGRMSSVLKSLKGEGPEKNWLR